MTDGTGGYAMGTGAGLRTRRDHGLLVLPRPARMCLAALDPVLTLASGARVPLAVHEWASGAVAPTGHHLLETFDLTDGLPRWRWRIGDVVVERELAMERGRTALAAVHRVLAAPEPVRLTLGALCTWREAGAIRTAAAAPPWVEHVADGAVVESAYRLAGPGWRPGGEWYFGAFTRQEAAAGRDPLEDLWFAGGFTAVLAPGEALEVSAWAGDLAAPPPPAGEVVAAARRRARKLVRAAKPADDIDAHLALAVDAGIVRTAEGIDVVDGYPGCGPSPHAALAGYEGLFLETGRAAEGRELLQGYRGRLPGGTTALWYAHAVERHVTRTGDTDLATALLSTVDSIVDGRLDRADPADGLVEEPATRPGKPVDVNALWVNALGALARLRELTGRDATAIWSHHETARTGFAKRFPAPNGWLHDIVDAPPPPYPLAGSRPYDDPALRPEQLLAWSLPYGPLDGSDPAPLHAVGAHLLTPLGPRTLAPTEYGYAPVDPGPQGSARPWLIGAYTAACQAVGLPVDGVLAGLEAHLSEWGLGSVSEIVAGDAPYHPGGRPFHPLSAAELLRARRLLAPPATTRPTAARHPRPSP